MFVFFWMFSKKTVNVVSVEWIDSSIGNEFLAAGSDFRYECVEYHYEGRNGGVWRVDYSKMDLIGKLLTGGTGKALKPEKFLGIPLACSYNDLYGFFSVKETPIVLSNCYYNIWIDKSYSLLPPDEQLFKTCEIEFLETGDDKDSTKQIVISESFYYNSLIAEENENNTLTTSYYEQYCCGYLRLFVKELECLYTSLRVFRVNEVYYIEQLDSFFQESEVMHLLRLNDELQNTIAMMVKNIDG